MAPQPIFLNLTFFNLFLAAATLAGAWLAVRYENKFFLQVVDRYPRARFLAKMVEPLVRVGVWLVAALLVMQILAPSKDAFIAVLGSAAIAIGLGAQDLIKNLIGGLAIIAVRPFQVGDRVKIGDAYGEITEIGLQTTTLVTPGDTTVTIPNSTILSGMSFNANTGVPDCQVATIVYLPPHADPDLALRLGREAAFASAYLHLAKPVTVLISDAFSEAPYQQLTIKGYVYDHRYEEAMKSDITRRIKREFLEQGMLRGWATND